MVISLYSVRLVLAALGESDYGVFNVIGGTVAMLSFFQTALSVSTQRYLSFYHGKGNQQLLFKIFNNSIILHISMALVVVALLEIIGNYFIDFYLQIPQDRMEAAKIIFHFSCATIFFSIVSVPYTAAINANEKLVFIALISILESIEKLALAIFLGYTSHDKLVVYGFLMVCITFVSFVLYYVICKCKFSECRHFSFSTINKSTLKELTGFASWNVVGSLTAMSKNQGMAVLFNMFKGPAVNAAYAIAHHISGQLQFFSITMLRAINPQIMKSEGAGNHQRMLKLSVLASKYGFLLLAFFAIPCIFEMNFLLDLWLKDVPKHTVYFCDLILLAMMLDQLTVGINSGFQACNLVKYSSIFVGFTKLLILPVGYVLLKINMSVYAVVLGYALVELFAGWVRIIIAKKMMNLSLLYYVKEVYLKITFPALASIFGCAIINHFISNEIRFIITGFTSSFLFLLITYIFSLDDEERDVLKNILCKLRKKMHV